MPSPFPGMNPYLERPGAWHSFHEAFISALKRELVRLTPAQYVIDVDLTVYLEEPSADERRPFGKPDVFVAHDARSSSSAIVSADAGTTATVAARPPTAFVPHASYIGEYTEQTIEIRDAADARVITAIEVLSPSNKTSSGDRGRYLRKRMTYRRARTNLLEIDLLRAGRRPDMDAPLPRCDYLVMLTRAAAPDQAEVWPFALREPLPPVPVPLDEGDPDVVLDLQRLLHQTYDENGFDRSVHRGEPEPLLAPDDAAWARALLDAAGVPVAAPAR